MFLSIGSFLVWLSCFHHWVFFLYIPMLLICLTFGNNVFNLGTMYKKLPRNIDLLLGFGMDLAFYKYIYLVSWPWGTIWKSDIHTFSYNYPRHMNTTWKTSRFGENRERKFLGLTEHCTATKVLKLEDTGYLLIDIPNIFSA